MSPHPAPEAHPSEDDPSDGRLPADRLPSEVRGALREFARHKSLLIACDYDGTLAPIVNDPARAFPDPASARALAELADLPGVSVAVITGRSLATLATLIELPDTVRAIGSHGAELDGDFANSLTDAQRELHERVYTALREIAGPRPGASVEHKPISAALHVRNASRPDAAAALDLARRGPAALPGVHWLEGKEVIEIAVLEVDKGTALDILRTQTAADAVFFIGDDVTDEKGFARLTGPDVGIKVGDAPSLARYRVHDTGDVAAVLQLLVASRA